MTQLRCQGCGRIVSDTQAEVGDGCKKCETDPAFVVKGSKEDIYDPKNPPIQNTSEQDEDSEEDEDLCAHCNKPDKTGDGLYGCDECGDDICENCLVPRISNITICKKCIDEKYPRKVETKIEKIVEFKEVPTKVFVDEDGTPIDTSFNPDKTSKYD